MKYVVPAGVGALLTISGYALNEIIRMNKDLEVLRQELLELQSNQERIDDKANEIRKYATGKVDKDITYRSFVAMNKRIDTLTHYLLQVPLTLEEKRLLFQGPPEIPVAPP